MLAPGWIGCHPEIRDKFWESQFSVPILKATDSSECTQSTVKSDSKRHKRELLPLAKECV